VSVPAVKEPKDWSAQDEALRLRCPDGKIGIIDFSDHHLVFRLPTRIEAREYRRKEDSPAEKPDRLDQLATSIIVAFDGEEDTFKARGLFLDFLVKFPLFCDGPKPQTVFSVLLGVQEVEHSTILGKGCSVRSSPPPTSPTA
jgi:hypothetical protein